MKINKRGRWCLNCLPFLMPEPFYDLRLSLIMGTEYPFDTIARIIRRNTRLWVIVVYCGKSFIIDY